MHHANLIVIQAKAFLTRLYSAWVIVPARFLSITTSIDETKIVWFHNRWNYIRKHNPFHDYLPSYHQLFCPHVRTTQT